MGIDELDDSHFSFLHGLVHYSLSQGYFISYGSETITLINLNYKFALERIRILFLWVDVVYAI